ncbi:MAG: hypothetical protein J1E97_04060 [Muribaculaceae bacterium]|nr:hypothetical protein [Muribaculaceae bacterium]
MEERYPWFIFQMLKTFRESEDEAERQRLAMQIACNVSDVETLRALLGSSAPDLRNFYSGQGAENSSDSAIDAFIEKFGGGIPDMSVSPPGYPLDSYPIEEDLFVVEEKVEALLPEEENQTAEAPVPVQETVEVSAEPEVLAEQEIPAVPEVKEAPASAEEQPPLEAEVAPQDPAPINEKPASAPQEPVSVVETPVAAQEAPTSLEPDLLAELEGRGVDPMEEVKRLVKTGDYRYALQIMEQINLKNPKKSIYFADQIRFIRLLVETKDKKD